MRVCRIFHMALRGAGCLLTFVVLMGGINGCSPKDMKEEKPKAPRGILFCVGLGLLFLPGFTKDGLKSTRMITRRRSLVMIELAVERVPADSSGRMSKKRTVWILEQVMPR